jgi:hypothetical protein
MTRKMLGKGALVLAALVIGVAGGSVLAQDTQLVEFKPKKTLKLRDLPRGGVKMIKNGGCCAHVGGACITWCNKEEGCTGDGDCDVNPNDRRASASADAR